MQERTQRRKLPRIIVLTALGLTMMTTIGRVSYTAGWRRASLLDVAAHQITLPSVAIDRIERGEIEEAERGLRMQVFSGAAIATETLSQRRVSRSTRRELLRSLGRALHDDILREQLLSSFGERPGVRALYDEAVQSYTEFLEGWNSNTRGSQQQ